MNDRHHDEEDRTLSFAVLSNGTAVGAYRIERRLGVGGMGEVYLARDTRLDRRVALKFLGQRLAGDANNRTRFLREARAMAALHHPNIVHIYEISEIHGRPFYAMEYVDGPTLAQRLRQGPLTTEQCIDIGYQVAAGLCEIHEAGIIHRDLKPSNIMLDRRGRAYISDFGLAAVTGQASLTRSGAVLGTMGYMSPEQALGGEVDSRSDIFALGIVLYEMVSGRSPFRRDDDAGTFKAIATEDLPPLSRVAPDIPETFSDAVQIALAKDPGKRYATTYDLFTDLQTLHAAGRSSATGSRLVVTTSRRRRRVIQLLAGLTTIAVLVSLLLFFTRKQPTETLVVPKQQRLTFFNDAYYGAISPDGRQIAYSLVGEASDSSVWVRNIEAEEPIRVFHGEGTYDLNWSPNSSELLFAGIQNSRPGIYLVPALGGEARRYNYTLPERPSVSWAPDGSRFAANMTESTPKTIGIFDRKSGERSDVIVDGPFERVQFVEWSPDGTRFAFTSLAPNGLWTCRVDGSDALEIVPGVLSPPCWSPDGKALYYVQWTGATQELRKITLNPATGRAADDPEILLTGVRLAGQAELSVSADGKSLACTMEQRWVDLWWIRKIHSESGDSLESVKLSALATRHSWPAFSPDGNTLAYQTQLGNGESHIFTTDLLTRARRRITYDNLLNFSPAWSPDGKQLAFGRAVQRGDNYRVSLVDLKSGRVTVFDSSLISEEELAVIWSPGQKILFENRGNRSFSLLDPMTGAEEIPFTVDSGAALTSPAYSSSGELIAFRCDYGTTNAAAAPRDSSGIWLYRLGTPSPWRISGAEGYPIGWSEDDRWVYLLRDRTILGIDTSGTATDTIIELPINNPWRRISMTRDARNFACLEWNYITDIWLVEDFDR